MFNRVHLIPIICFKFKSDALDLFVKQFSSFIGVHNDLKGKKIISLFYINSYTYMYVLCIHKVVHFDITCGGDCAAVAR